MKNKIKVLTFGVFDYFHYGHLKLLERCKKQCGTDGVLIVAVQEEGEIRKTKPAAKVLYSTAQRKEMIENIKYVNRVVEYKQVDEDIKHIDFDVLVVGEDQNHAGFKRAIEWCHQNGKSVVTLQRTPGICSSQIKEQI